MDPVITTVGTQPGIPFGPNNMRATYMTSMYNGTQLGITAPYFLSELRMARSKGGRFVQKMAGKRDEDIQNADGTFSLTKWKALVNTFKGIDFNSYIADGTLMGHFLIDEPEFAKRWGGKAISQATIEEMARYSKQLWPNLPNVRTGAAQLAGTSPHHLPVPGRRLGSGLHVQPGCGGLGKGRSRCSEAQGSWYDRGHPHSRWWERVERIRGWLPNHWSMSASEIRTHGTRDAQRAPGLRLLPLYLSGWWVRLPGSVRYQGSGD